MKPYCCYKCLYFRKVTICHSWQSKPLIHHSWQYNFISQRSKWKITVTIIKFKNKANFIHNAMEKPGRREGFKMANEATCVKVCTVHHTHQTALPREEGLSYSAGPCADTDLSTYTSSLEVLCNWVTEGHTTENRPTSCTAPAEGTSAHTSCFLGCRTVLNC